MTGAHNILAHHHRTHGGGAWVVVSTKKSYNTHTISDASVPFYEDSVPFLSITIVA